jgi:hypothetical protein
MAWKRMRKQSAPCKGPQGCVQKLHLSHYRARRSTRKPYGTDVTRKRYVKYGHSPSVPVSVIGICRTYTVRTYCPYGRFRGRIIRYERSPSFNSAKLFCLLIPFRGWLKLLQQWRFGAEGCFSPFYPYVLGRSFPEL